MEIIFATSNQNKVNEVNEILSNTGITIFSLSDIGYTDEIEETGKTLEENSEIKASTLFKERAVNVFSEDTGLEVDALNGAPGVYTARYGGPEKNADQNMNKLLTALQDKDTRKARFRTSICLILNEKIHFFEGVLNGSISHDKLGSGGFGYDPIFVPEGYDKTLGQLDAAIKSKISHRARAVEKLVAFLRSQKI